MRNFLSGLLGGATNLGRTPPKLNVPENTSREAMLVDLLNEKLAEKFQENDELSIEDKPEITEDHVAFSSRDKIDARTKEYFGTVWQIEISSAPLYPHINLDDSLTTAVAELFGVKPKDISISSMEKNRNDKEVEVSKPIGSGDDDKPDDFEIAAQ